MDTFRSRGQTTWLQFVVFCENKKLILPRAHFKRQGKYHNRPPVTPRQLLNVIWNGCKLWVLCWLCGSIPLLSLYVSFLDLRPFRWENTRVREAAVVLRYTLLATSALLSMTSLRFVPLCHRPHLAYLLHQHVGAVRFHHCLDSVSESVLYYCLHSFI